MTILLKNKKTFVFLLILIFALLPGISPLLHPGFFQTDDGNWMVIRFSAFYEALRNGQFPVRYLPRLNFGYGYPVADFLYPLFMYLAVPIHILGFNFVNSIKMLFGLSLLFSSLFMFFWLRNSFSNKSSLIGALAYGIFPYHLWDIYKRGSIGEVLALATIPYVLWQIDKKNIYTSSIGIALLIVSHNSLALLFMPILLIYMLIKLPVRKTAFALVSGLGISSFFWIPALVDKQYTVFDMTSVSDFSSYFIDTKTIALLGIITPIALLCGIYMYLKKRKRLFLFFTITLFVSVFLTLPISGVFWQVLPFKDFIQFPFRVLSVSAVCVGFLLSGTLENITKKHFTPVFISIVVVIYISAWTFFVPQTYQSFPDTFYSTNVDSTTVKNEYMPIYVKSSLNAPKSQNTQVMSGSAKIKNENVRGTNVKFIVIAKSVAFVQVNFIYFPGWVAYVDGDSVPISYDNQQGFMRISVNPGSHSVHFVFRETSFRLICDIITVASLLSLIAVFTIERMKNEAS